MKTAIYPGSFDPITLGHLNIIKRAAVCFDKLIVCVMVNSEKVNRGLFTPEERSRDLRKAANDYCEDALRRTEEAVAEAYDEIKKSRARFRALAGGGAPAGRQPYDVEAE